MDLQTMLNNAVKAKRQEELKSSDQLMLGELILKLESVKNKQLPLFINKTKKRPKGIDSWRGSYNELSIQTKDFGSYNTDKVYWESDDGEYKSYEQKEIGKENPTVQEWIDVLEEAVGKTFTGYKGGDFLMSKNTPVWLNEYGEYSREYFVDVEETKTRVNLITFIDED